MWRHQSIPFSIDNSSLDRIFHQILHFDIEYTIWHCTNWWPIGADFPCSKTSNATLTFSISLDIAFTHKVSPFLASRARACFTVIGSSMPNLWHFFKYLVCHFLTLATILSLFLCTCLTHQLKFGSWSIPCATANSVVCTRWDSFHSDNFSHEIESSFQWQKICQPAVVIQVTGLSHTAFCFSDKEITSLSLEW